MNTCGTCRYWGKLKDFDFAGIIHRPCTRIIHDSDYDATPVVCEWDEDEVDEGNKRIDKVRNEPALTQDGSGYHAALRTRDDFGCTLWEGKVD